MLIPILVLAVMSSDGDSTVKKPVTHAPALPAATHSMSNVARKALPRAPALPSSIHATANAVPLTADSIVVEKAHHTLTLYYRGAPVRLYFVALGTHPVGAKQVQGDGKTPEGLYFIEGHNPESKYHLSLRVSYPNADDIVTAKSRGASTGGDIMIHGLPNGRGAVGASHRLTDWTSGCIAVTDAEIEEIWQAIPDGATIQIKP